MAINAQFPSWITEGRIAEAQLGQQMGRNILEGLRFQEQKRQEERRIPLINAQTELMKANTTSQLIKNQQDLLAANLNNEANAAMTEAMKFQSDINRSGGWAKPDSEVRLYEFLSRYPSLGRTDWAKNIRDEINASKEFQRKGEFLKQQGDQEMEQIRLRGEIQKDVQDKGTFNISVPGLQFGGTQKTLEKLMESNPQFKAYIEGLGESAPFTSQLGRDEFGSPTYKLQFKQGVPMEKQVEILRQFQGALGGGMVTPGLPAPGAPRNTPVAPAAGGGFGYKGFTVSPP